jgi:hypothetical protein
MMSSHTNCYPYYILLNIFKLRPPCYITPMLHYL